MTEAVYSDGGLAVLPVVNTATGRASRSLLQVVHVQSGLPVSVRVHTTLAGAVGTLGALVETGVDWHEDWDGISRYLEEHPAKLRNVRRIMKGKGVTKWEDAMRGRYFAERRDYIRNNHSEFNCLLRLRVPRDGCEGESPRRRALRKGIL